MNRTELAKEFFEAIDLYTPSTEQPSLKVAKRCMDICTKAQIGLLKELFVPNLAISPHETISEKIKILESLLTDK